MHDIIFKIKISLPPLDPRNLSRPQLIHRLNQNFLTVNGFSRQLTLLSAPAGYGKTTLVLQWLDHKKNSSAWFSIDEADNDQTRFWIYFIHALRTCMDEIGRGALDILHSAGNGVSREPISPDFMISLLNELFMLEKPIILVLDDYHLIHHSGIHNLMAFFIENIPPMVHIVITTRSDPPWPLAKWRAKNIIHDVRLSTLSFTEKETDTLFAQSEGLNLSDRQISALYEKTEGWVTGLKLAALSLTATQDRDVFIKQFTGTSRHILSFLIEEVLARQTGSVLNFLLKTSILPRFCIDLCDKTIGCHDSTDLIAQLEKINLFIISLDDQGIWYRYHPLFADVLTAKLKSQHAGQLAELYDRAGQWFLENGNPGEAVRLMIAGNLDEKAGQILHDHYDVILQSDGPSLLYNSLNRFTDELKMKFPRLMAHMALYALIHQGQAAAKHYLDLADTLAYQNNKVQNEYAGILSAVKAYYHIFSSDYKQAVQYAESASAMLSDENFYWRMNTAIYLGDALLFSGQPQQAFKHYQQAQSSSRKIGNLVLQMNTGFKSAYSLYMMGRLNESESLVLRLINQAKKVGLANIARAGLLWTLYGELLREKGNLQEARPSVERGVLYSESEKPCLGWNYLFEADLFLSLRQYEAAMQTIEEINQLHLEVTLPFFVTFPATLRKARILLETGQISTARYCLADVGVAETVPASMGTECGYLILAEILMAESDAKARQIRQMLAEIDAIAIEGNSQGLLIESGLLAARLAEKEGQLETAEKLLFKALRTGNEMGYFQIFADRKEKIIPIIEQLSASGKIFLRSNMISDRLVHLFSDGIQDRSDIKQAAPARIPDLSAAEKLIEDLSARELEVLTLISKGLSNQEISDQLFLTIGTVKWHTSNIYGKMGVRGRTQAVALARETNLID